MAAETRGRISGEASVRIRRVEHERQCFNRPKREAAFEATAARGATVDNSGEIPDEGLNLNILPLDVKDIDVGADSAFIGTALDAELVVGGAR